MKKILILTLFFGAFARIWAQSEPDLILKNVNLIPISENRVLPKQSIAISNGMIAEIGDFKKIKKGKHTKIINAKGKFLAPGLAEMHAHLPGIQALDTFLISNVAAGVTRLRAMNYETATSLEIKEAATGKSIAPHIYYSYKITRDMKLSTAQADSLMNQIRVQGYDFVKLFSVANDTVFSDIMHAAPKYQMIVCGHYLRNVSFDKLIESGYRSIEHLDGYKDIKEENHVKAAQFTLKNNVFNCPTLDWDVMAADLSLFDDYKTRLVFSNAPRHWIDRWNNEREKHINELGADKIKEKATKYRPVFDKKMRVLKALQEAGAPLLLGSDPGGLYQMAGFNLYEEMQIWSKAGLSNFDILKAATLTPAYFFGEQDKWGSIEVGKAADLILLTKNPLQDLKNMQTVECTIVGGKIFYKKDLLNKI